MDLCGLPKARIKVAIHNTYTPALNYKRYELRRKKKKRLNTIQALVW